MQQLTQPLQLICLPLRTSANVAWTSILAVREEIYDEWIARVGGRWDSKISEVVAKKQIPQLQNGAARFRDEEPEIIYRTAALWVHFLPELTKRLSGAELKTKQAEFRRGALDDDLKPLCKLMDKNIKITDIRFVSSSAVQQCENNNAAAESLSEAHKAARLADFNLFAELLRNEQSVMPSNSSIMFCLNTWLSSNACLCKRVQLLIN